MSVCINKNSLEYQSLNERAGIPEFTLESICRDFVSKYNRFPYLDEIVDSNSEPHLRSILNVKANDGIKINKLLEMTGKETVEDAVIDINNKYRDIEMQVVPIVDEAIVHITHRPTVNNFEEVEIFESNIDNDFVIFNKSLEKLATIYGIKFNEISDEELASEEWSQLVPDAQSVNAFVYNGQIYINTSRAKADAPIHELFHIFVGSMRFTNPELYQNLINTVEQLENYEALTQRFINRSRNDINEEIFITELAQYLAGMPSELQKLNEKQTYELTYNIKRTLDSVLMGTDSVRTISDDRLYNMSFKDLIREVNSSLATCNFGGFVNLDGAELHRKLNNIKSDLFKNNLLEEICD